MRVSLAVTAVVAALCAAPAALAAEHAELRDADAYARVTDAEVVVGNAVAERRFTRSSFATSQLVDKRRGGRTWSRAARDFTLTVGGAEIGSDSFNATSVKLSRAGRGGVRAAIELELPAGGAALSATRIVEVYPGVAGFRTQTVLHPLAPAVLSAATLDEAAVGSAAPSLHSLRAGADWRSPDWEGPQVWVGYAQPGTWRETRTGPAGQPLEGPAEWVTLEAGARSLVMVMERNDFPSSRGTYDGGTAALRVDYSRDILTLGPFEEQIHVENPGSGGGRTRALTPGRDFALEAAFTGFGDHDGDAEWQFHRYLTRHRLNPYPKAVTFNSNGTDSNKISTGAKDDMDLATVKQVAPLARSLGVDTFILDDGWQARSGDWQPDSPQYPEPRWDGSPGSKFKPRFPDATFAAVREAIAPMKLGLWMSPAHFHPTSQTYREHPEWGCAPVGQGTAAANVFDPESGSNEAGIGTWSPAAFPHVEARIREAIVSWGVSYFKFDFLLWLDCAGEGDMYEYKEKFVAMLDRLQRAHPDVTFQIDETNDYRLFPYESVTRGPSWFQNGSPEPERLLHNLWNLSPYVPASSLGQHFLGGKQYEKYPVATLMAAALPSHLTFFSDLRQLPASVIEQAAPWTAFHRRHRALLSGVVYPLLEDPLKKRWTALQSWDPDAAQGVLLAFRQGDEAGSKRIALRNVPPRRRFDLFRAPDGRYAGTVTSAQLTRGLLVKLAAKQTARVLVIKPAVRRPATRRTARRPARRPATRRGPRFTG